MQEIVPYHWPEFWERSIPDGPVWVATLTRHLFGRGESLVVPSMCCWCSAPAVAYHPETTAVTHTSYGVTTNRYETTSLSIVRHCCARHAELVTSAAQAERARKGSLRNLAVVLVGLCAFFLMPFAVAVLAGDDLSLRGVVATAIIGIIGIAALSYVILVGRRAIYSAAHRELAAAGCGIAASLGTMKIAFSHRAVAEAFVAANPALVEPELEEQAYRHFRKEASRICVAPHNEVEIIWRRSGVMLLSFPNRVQKVSMWCRYALFNAPPDPPQAYPPQAD